MSLGFTPRFLNLSTGSGLFLSSLAISEPIKGLGLGGCNANFRYFTAKQ
jgi:hypothetical protein